MPHVPPVFALVVGTSLTWIDVTVLGIFALGIVLVLLVPFTLDLLASHKTYRKLVTATPPRPAPGKGPQGMQGLARATMAFSVIAVIGFALGYILVEKPFEDNKTITSNIMVALTTTLASITAFYFGSRLATQAQRDAADATAKGVAAGAGTPVSPISIVINTPPDGAVYTQNDVVVADWVCTPSTGAQLRTCNGTVAAGSQIDTSQQGPFTFTVQATDSAGQSTQLSHAYTVQ
jgi:hypothetical protein